MPLSHLVAALLAAASVQAPPAEPLSTYLVVPCRFLDTRTEAAPIEWGFRFGTLQGACGVPVGARAVLVNITVTQATAPGYLSVFSSERRDSMLPTTSTLNFAPGQTIANAAIIPVCSPAKRASKATSGSTP